MNETAKPSRKFSWVPVVGVCQLTFMVFCVVAGTSWTMFCGGPIWVVAEAGDARARTLAAERVAVATAAPSLKRFLVIVMMT